MSFVFVVARFIGQLQILGVMPKKSTDYAEVLIPPYPATHIG
ncbi:MAG: hypothetical protein V1244_02765 [Nitrospinaceae bacterium]|jgi:hypothetical protein|nr:hypothetical protein [Nitrospinaceae bacterium]MDP7148114.1 hypothetical protein [Nitrospinaceae bacterium]MEE1550529.1 hypothetical protein [Nitrospinaceae bacterium]|tara:strand:- start:1274 stop:1399 length:126 start_codon:yes stop_codon:yes gene_type:complete